MTQLTNVLARGTNAARPAAAASNNGFYYFETDTLKLFQSSGSAWIQVASIGGASPLTTKGDIFTHDTVDNRLAVGTDGKVLTADSAAATGLSWQTPAAGAADRVLWPIDLSPASFTTFTPVANTVYAARVRVARTGTLNNLAAYTTAAGHNIDIGVYDTSATTRNRLYRSGAVATVANGYVAVSGVGLAVTAGDMLDLALVVDSTLANIGHASASNANQYVLPTALLPGLGGVANIGWLAAAGGSTLPATVAESGFTNSAPVAIFGWIS
jgi:hypothetical protein